MYTFKEIDHTADLAYQLIATTQEALFSAALGAYKNSVLPQHKYNAAKDITLSLQGNSIEELIVDFLREINYLLTEKGWVPEKIINARLIFENGFKAKINVAGHESGKNKLELKEEIKAITYHQLAVVKTNEGYKTNLIFDI
ncbi:MAG: archease [Bacteroidetes bacterium]|nr:archease [Bacteroidota bacterium]